MSIEVLAQWSDNVHARMEMRRRGLDCATPRLVKLLRRMRLISGVNVGLRQKSWDVLRTLQFLEQHVDKTMPILDVGAHSSEILLSLHKLGFCDLTGIDLDPQVKRMPLGKSIKYMTGDFTRTTFPDGSFGAITAISVLEHGYCGPNVFREISRMLKAGGFLIGSTDYWPEKIDTSDVMVYGLDWTIFSRDELCSFVQTAAKYDLVPFGPLHFEASEATIHWLKRRYTFAWFGFQKLNVGVELPGGDSGPWK